MPITRRTTLGLGAAAAAGAGLPGIVPFGALAATGASHAHPTDTGEIVIHPVSHATFVMETPSMVIYNDPVGGAETFADMPAPDLILVTHRHGDHFDAPTLEGLGDAPILTNRDVHDLMPEGLRARAEVIAPGAGTEVGGMPVEAIPAYNVTEGRLQYHPRERGDLGLVLTIDGRRVYIAGDTEATDEMRALRDIDIAFVPMNLPYTMTPGQAGEGVAAFAPRVVYPYHYRGSDLDAFAARVGAAGAGIEIVRAQWYPG